VNLPLAKSDVDRATAKPIGGPVRDGFRLDRTHRLAAQLAWLLTLIVALVSVWPAWEWLSSALAYNPRGDVVTDRVDLVVLKELVQFDRASTLGLVNAAMAGGVVLALLLNPLLAGGVIALVTGAPTAGRSSHRFFDAGVRFYGRFLRALFYVGVVAALAASLVWGLGILASDALADRGLERAAVAAYALRLVAIGLVAAFFTAVLDLARLRVAAADSRHVLVACVDAFRLALRRLGALARIGAAFLGLLAAVAVVLFTIRANLPGGGWIWLVVALVLQQAAAYARVRLRVATVAALGSLARPRTPPVLAAPDVQFAEYDRDDRDA
jgi:hypothetical protein